MDQSGDVKEEGERRRRRRGGRLIEDTFFPRLPLFHLITSRYISHPLASNSSHLLSPSVEDWLVGWLQEYDEDATSDGDEPI